MVEQQPIVIRIPIRLDSTNEQLREYREERARRAGRQRKLALMLCVGPARRFGPALSQGRTLSIALVRIGPGTLDDDNLAGACKAVRDGVADALGLPDSDRRLRFTYGQRKGQPRPRGLPAEYGVEITLTQAAPAAETSP